MPIILQDPFTRLNEKDPGDADSATGSGKAVRREPGHTRDNAQLVEEAINQEIGVAQHIFNWINQWDRTGQGRTRDFLFAYTMELPLGTQTHQFSFTTQFLAALDKPNGGTAMHQGGVGDTFLNYRYQLLADDDFLWCAPRFSLILPTGDERFGLGAGQLGYQFNLPVSRYGDRFDLHFNAGTTYTPNVSTFLMPDEGSPGNTRPGNNAMPMGAANGPVLGPRSPRFDLHGYNLGASVYWKPRTYLHFFVEGLAVWNDVIDERGARGRTSQVVINPGFRYAACQFEEVEWVLGVAIPVGLTRDTPDIGVFVYMSVEHTFHKLMNGGSE